MKMNLTIILAASFAANAAATKAAAIVKSVQLGPRPFFLVEEMRDISLKDELSTYLLSYPALTAASSNSSPYMKWNEPLSPALRSLVLQ
jgi:hypothetical protein